MIIRIRFKYRQIPIDIEMDSLDEELAISKFAPLIDTTREFIDKVLEK